MRRCRLRGGRGVAASAERHAVSPRQRPSSAERGLLDKPWLLALVRARNGRRDARFAPASISSPPGTTPLTLLAKLVAGEVYLHQITIVEGSRFAEVLAALRAHPAIAATELDGAAIMSRARRARRSSGRAVLSGHLSVSVRHSGRRGSARSRTRRSSRGSQAAWRDRSPDLLLQDGLRSADPRVDHREGDGARPPSAS